MPRPTNRPPDGDAQFLGVNQADPPATLPPGTLANAKNNRCRHGRGEPRLGPVKLPWTNRVTTSAPSTPIPFGTIYGAGVFRDSIDVQWGIVAADGKVYRFREGNGSNEVPLPPGVSITGPVEFEQTYNGLIMFRGADLAELKMATLDAGFTTITQEANVVTGAMSENQSDGTEAIPNADRGAFINGRLFVPYKTATEKDLVGISDYNNSTRYAPVRSQGRINQGSSDKLVRILKFGKSEIAVCFKDGSIYELAGISGSLSNMSQDEITREFGLAAPKAAINVGKDEADQPDEVWFLANKRGFMRITPDPSTGRLGVQSIPVTREVADVIERINWGAIAGATVAIWDNKFYAAIPIDDATVASPNMIPEGATYDVGGLYSVVVTPGARYRWTKVGAADEGIFFDEDAVPGQEQLTETGDFTHTGESGGLDGLLVNLSGTPGEPITATLQRVYTECNNAVLVYDFERGAWCSVDTGSAITVKEWLKLRFGGEERLFFLGEDGFINCYEWLFDDQSAVESYGANLNTGQVYNGAGFYSLAVQSGRAYLYNLATGGSISLVNGTETITAPAVGTFVAQGSAVELRGLAGFGIDVDIYLVDWTLVSEDIDHDITLRAYLQGSLERKRGLWARFHFRSWFPSLSISEITEGVEEEIMRLEDETRSRTRYTRPHSKPAYDVTNINDDHATPHREDYSVVLEENTVASGDIQAGVRYLVESSDVVSACSISYNAVTYTNGETFVGVAGVTVFGVTLGTPLVKPPDSYVFMGDHGIEPDRHQEWSQDVRLHASGRERQFRVRNQQGRCELVAVEIFGKDVDQRPGKRT